MSPNRRGPFRPLVEPVGVIDDVAHLVPQVAQHVGPAAALDEAAALGVEVGQIDAGQIKGNGDGDRPERDAPLGGEVEVGPDLDDAAVGEFLLEFPA